MKQLAEIRRRENTRAARQSNGVRKKLQLLKVPLSKKLDRIPTDLGDIEEVCSIYIKTVKLLRSSTAKNRAVAVALLKSIRNDLYIHLAYHLRGLRNPLNILIDELEKKSVPRKNLRNGKQATSKTRLGGRPG